MARHTALSIITVPDPADRACSDRSNEPGRRRALDRAADEGTGVGGSEIVGLLFVRIHYFVPMGTLS